MRSSLPPENVERPGGGGDLAQNRPGQQVRARADELRGDAPIRSLVGRMLGVRSDERAFRIGAQGEQIVARRLRTLDPAAWRVLHSVPVGAGHSDIDHVVIGPPGVFTLNTKHHPDAGVFVARSGVWVNGHRYGYVRASRSEARRAGSLLGAACGVPVAVTPVIVVIARRCTVRGLPRGVVVVEDRAVIAWLRSLPRRWQPSRVESVYEWARRASTWTERTAGPVTPAGSAAGPRSPTGTVRP